MQTTPEQIPCSGVFRFSPPLPAYCLAQSISEIRLNSGYRPRLEAHPGEPIREKGRRRVAVKMGYAARDRMYYIDVAVRGLVDRFSEEVSNLAEE